jgi:hypothetical protein
MDNNVNDDNNVNEVSEDKKVVLDENAIKFLQKISLNMCERAVKSLLNKACNNLLRFLYSDKSVEIYGDNTNNLRLQMRKYFVGKIPDDDIFINFFEIQETLSNVKIFYNQEDANRFNYLAKSIAENEHNINEINEINNDEINNEIKKEQINIINKTFFVNDVSIDYSLYKFLNSESELNLSNEINSEEFSKLNDFMKNQIDIHWTNLCPMVIYTFTTIIQDIKLNRKEIYSLIHSFIKPGISDDKTIQLLSETNLLNIQSDFPYFNRIGGCLI